MEIIIVPELLTLEEIEAMPELVLKIQKGKKTTEEYSDPNSSLYCDKSHIGF